MSDEHKPHDEHGHDSGPAHDDHAPAAPAAGHDDHAPAAHDDHGHDAPVDAAHDDHGRAAETHAEPVEPVHVEDSHGEDHGHAAPEAHDPHLTPAETTAAGSAAASEKRPVWSDHGDAPFEDVDATPVYARGKTSKKTSGGGGNEFVEIVKTILFALLIAVVLRTLLFQPFTIPSASMEPNLYEGDYIVVSKWSYGYSRHSIPFSPALFKGRILEQAPHRGDIVVFKLPRDDKTDYIKRLIGLPGDRVQMINNLLYINGAAVEDVQLSRQDVANVYGLPVIHTRETLPNGKTFTIQDFGPGNNLDDTQVFEIPAGHYFMMGDNRDNSIDSRVEKSAGVGLVPAENLIGKAQIILFSWSPGVTWNPVSWFTKIRPSRFFTVLD